jgi:hypothetical protein
MATTMPSDATINQEANNLVAKETANQVRHDAQHKMRTQHECDGTTAINDNNDNGDDAIRHNNQPRGRQEHEYE